MKGSDAFISFLESLAGRDDRAALAKLRRGLGQSPGTAVEMFPLVVPYLPESQRAHAAYFLVASLFGSHPESTSEGNLGDTCRRFGDHPSAVKRFTALLGCHEDELGDHLRHVVSLARSKDVPVNYLQLLRDITNWAHEARFVQLAWARSYWRQAETTSKSEQGTEPADTDDVG